MKYVPHSGAFCNLSKRFCRLLFCVKILHCYNLNIQTSTNAFVMQAIRHAIIVPFDQCLIRCQIAKIECLRMIRHRVFQLVARSGTEWKLDSIRIFGRHDELTDRMVAHGISFAWWAFEYSQRLPREIKPMRNTSYWDMNSHGDLASLQEVLFRACLGFVLLSTHVNA